MNRVWFARIAAPAAFLAGVTLAVVLVRAGLGDGDQNDTGTAVTLSVSSRPTTTTKPAKRAYARVREGDTLASIAERHKTSVGALLDLNPGLDPNNLQIGQRVRVR